MAEICCGVVSDNEATVSYDSRSRAARRRRMEIRNEMENLEQRKRQRVEKHGKYDAVNDKNDEIKTNRFVFRGTSESEETPGFETPKFGFASVCGRRREMEDAVSLRPSFSRKDSETRNDLMHYFGVFDGHGCSHVAMRCRDRMHAVLKEELANREDTTSPIDWKSVMQRSFSRMDQEVIELNKNVERNDCRCELQAPDRDAVGSTAVVAVVTRDEIIVANCGDSRAVLCRGGKAIALSSDHKVRHPLDLNSWTVLRTPRGLISIMPCVLIVSFMFFVVQPDRPDELERIESAGGRVIYWNGPRVLGVLAMSRAIGDNYLKPYVTSEPEITITTRTAEDECLILASDGLWDVVSNQAACGVARMCLNGKGLKNSPWAEGDKSDKACADTSMLLTKLALARHSTDNVSVVVVDMRK
ncbi:hypothetical protein QQ045_016557 [Rhodiola kirilowii]